jgi:hypothetical protein
MRLKMTVLTHNFFALNNMFLLWLLPLSAAAVENLLVAPPTSPVVSLRNLLSAPNLDDGSSPGQPFAFRFLKRDYSSLHVNINGGVTFGAPLSTFTPVCAPLGHSEKLLIAPYWSDVDLRVAGKGNVYFFQTNNADWVSSQLFAWHNNSGTAPVELTNGTAFVASWDNVFPYDAFASTAVTPLQTNTFQLALYSDGAHERFFVSFRYQKLSWNRGSASNVSARAGFDNGEGTMYVLGDSCKDTVNETLMQQSSASQPAGVYVFEVGDAAPSWLHQVTLPPVTPRPTKKTTTTPVDLHAEQRQEIARTKVGMKREFEASCVEVAQRHEALLPAYIALYHRYAGLVVEMEEAQRHNKWTEVGLALQMAKSVESSLKQLL